MKKPDGANKHEADGIYVTLRFPELIVNALKRYAKDHQLSKNEANIRILARFLKDNGYIQ